MFPEIDIIVLSYLESDRLIKCVDSVLMSTYPNIRVFIVDNGSGPEVTARIKDRYSGRAKVVLIENGRNLGYAGGNNIALKIAEGRYCVMLNNDAIVDCNWLEPMVELMEKNPGAGACQPKILNINDPGRFEYAGAAGGYIDIYGYPFMRGRIFDTIESDNGQYDDNAELDWCSGAAFMVRTDVFKKTGFFDPAFFMYAEEIDLCWRIRRCSYSILFVPRSKVYHEGMGSIKNRQIFKLHLNYRNNLILLLKNYSFIHLLSRMPVRMILDCVSAVYFLLNKPAKMRFLAILWAYGELIIMLPRIIYARCSVQRLFKDRCPEPVKYPLFDVNITFQYFILGKKKFNELILRRR